jgi:3-dehydroquinate synthase
MFLPLMSVHVSLDERSYDIQFQSLSTLPELLSDVGLRTGPCVVVTDENVAAHYRTPLRTTLEDAGWTPQVYVVPPGESTKSATHLHHLYDAILDAGIDRETPLLALGGGVVGDLAGFAAATLLRGLPLVHLPTSLIAQVDSSIGGKTAINHPTGKNLIGAFYQPDVVCTDVQTLDTLPQREWTSGMAEVIKHACIADPSLFETLDAHLVPVMNRQDRGVMQDVIRNAVQVKAEIVSEDEREAGRRAILNFGHTFGHAVESVAGYGTFTHGEAVALGMRAGLYLSHRAHPESLDRERIDHVINAVPWPGTPSELPFAALYEAMQHDKKNRGGEVRFVLLRELGHAYVTGGFSRDTLRRAWDFACT